ncbi:hypothetical protein FQN55_004729 [Onygenales sp. PD_40]|nr:hypothetical protein FQN55_004729 [Onygenales sp. PD_40]KAK2788585.1 hypothetical protein FQN53_003436 [Emmonsiellopsis sp. PD_33]KAK2792849.1 hypothetical protein FQN52_002526 [Onygenales sp. PD_12]KAK2805821.1 hypothetical protein FQN51_008594 [Onygenales sp. PD_10]
MNRFRTRKKAKEAPDGQNDGDAQPLPLFTSKTFKRGKKAPVESKSELDLSSALPSSDDFRTSLLMPNLSARFSMLREQDDPNSIIGKANDDSVLFPKRASRLNIFNQSNNPLSDIAEVSSLNGGSARPSLAIGRGSFASGEGYGTDEDYSPGGSMLGRSRPGEGNNLFGGRQKVYRIPMASTPRSGSASEASGVGMGGKAVYEMDVTLSAFQKLRAKEKEQQLELELEAQKNKQDAEDGSSLASRPSINRTSTSNTSVDSLHRNSSQRQNPSSPPNPTPPPLKPNPISTGVERNATKSRRYGQGIEPPSQPSAISRLESLSRQRAAVNDPSQINRSLSKSTTSLNEKFQNRPQVYASSGFRPTSPPPSASKTISEAMDSASKSSQANSATSNSAFGFSPPLSPPVSESEEQASFEAALQPEDRGKATAMGLFNKPATRYDESQFSRRQLQMYEGRDTPPLQRRSPPGGVPEPESTGRSRGLSNASYRSKVESMASSHYNGSQDEGPRSDRASAAASIRKQSPPRPVNGTFFSGADSGSEDEAEQSLDDKIAALQPLSEIHPALRASTDSGDSTTQSVLPKTSYSGTPEVRFSESRDLNTIEENDSSESPEPANETPDSPTLGPAGLGLSGLVRAHLRQESESSVYQPPSPDLPPQHTETRRQLDPAVHAARAADHAASVHSNPWEFDDLDKPSSSGSNKPHTPQQGHPDLSGMSMRAKQILGQATALRGQGLAQNTPSIPPLSEMRNRSPKNPPSKTPSWQEEVKHGHQRGGSSETQKEREELANELAERRRKVQEKLRSFAESESRSSSPSPGHRFPDYGPTSKPGNAFAMLKNKASKPPATGRQDVPHTKAMRMLGMDNPHSASSPNLLRNDSWREDEDSIHRDNMQEPRSSSPHVGPRNHHWQRPPQNTSVQRASQDDSGESFHGGPSPPSYRSSYRGRSGSDVSGRSKSQPRYRDDLGAVGENADNQNEVVSEESRSSKAATSVPSSARPSVEVNDHRSSERAPSAASGRFRSNSRSATQSYFESMPPLGIQTNHAELMGASSRPSPIAPYSANATPPLYETSPVHSSLSTPTLAPPIMGGLAAQRTQGLGTYKRQIDKSQISEPKFVSSTSNVPTVGLAPGVSLSNGASTPPIPPMNPRRRRQTTTQTILNAFKHSDKSDDSLIPSPTPTAQNEENSLFSDEEKRSRPRQRLRKISSEGGNLNAKARQQAMNTSSPALPQFPKKAPVEGGMF